MDTLATEIAAFIRSIRPLQDESKVLNSNDLYRDGILDSLSTLNLVHFLEAKCGITLGPFLVTRKNFSSVGSILSLVESARKQGD